MTDARIQFWPIGKVVEVTGLSKTEIYRRVRKGAFPASRAYPDSVRVFWTSAEIETWQRNCLAMKTEEFEALLSA